MGNPMAGHLLRAGFDVSVFDIRHDVARADERAVDVDQHEPDRAGAMVHGHGKLLEEW